MNAGKCSNPLSLLQTGDVRAIGYQDPALEGVNISFSCLPGLELAAGPKSATCTYGKWEPDPSNVECQGNDTL